MHVSFKKPNQYFIKIGGIIILVLIISSGAVWAAKNLISQNPLPLDAPAGAEYTLPENLPSRTGGPYRDIEDINQIAVLAGQSKDEIRPIVKNIILTTHGNLISSQIFSESYSVADDREVYLAILEGNFQFNRVRPNMEPIRSQQINIEIDANTGEVLALGTSELTKDLRVINDLKLFTNN